MPQPPGRARPQAHSTPTKACRRPSLPAPGLLSVPNTCSWACCLRALFPTREMTAARTAGAPQRSTARLPSSSGLGMTVAGGIPVCEGPKGGASGAVFEGPLLASRLCTTVQEAQLQKVILALAALLCKFRSFACSRHGSLGRYFRSTDETAGAKFAHHDYHMYISEACVATGAGIHTQARRHPRTAPALDTCSVLLAAVTSAGCPQQTARAVDVERAPGAGYQCPVATESMGRAMRRRQAARPAAGPWCWRCQVRGRRPSIKEEERTTEPQTGASSWEGTEEGVYRPTGEKRGRKSRDNCPGNW